MTRITPFDNFLHDLLIWLNGAWYVWVVVLVMIAVIVVTVVASKVIARRSRRVPKYRRSLAPGR